VQRANSAGLAIAQQPGERGQRTSTSSTLIIRSAHQDQVRDRGTKGEHLRMSRRQSLVALAGSASLLASSPHLLARAAWGLTGTTPVVPRGLTVDSYHYAFVAGAIVLAVGLVLAVALLPSLRGAHGVPELAAA
jgi:hypothetical protein